MEWKWVIAGVIAGLIIVGRIVLYRRPDVHSPAIQALVIMVGFSLTGVIVGYFSPGVTIREAGVGGAIVMVSVMALLAITGDQDKLVEDKFIDFPPFAPWHRILPCGAWRVRSSRPRVTTVGRMRIKPKMFPLEVGHRRRSHRFRLERALCFSDGSSVQLNQHAPIALRFVSFVSFKRDRISSLDSSRLA